MNNQKRLIYMFKAFTQKVFLPQCSKNDFVMNDWNKFSSLLSSDTINLNDVQSYIDSIGNSPQINPLLMQSQQSMPTIKKDDFYNHSSVYNRKKQESVPFENPQQMSFNPSKTFGGQKVKIPLYPNKPNEFDQLSRKQFTNSLNQNVKQDITKYRNTASNIGSAYKQTAIDNAPVMLASLQKLYKNLVQNQQKIEALTQINQQGGGGQIGNPSYF